MIYYSRIKTFDKEKTPQTPKKIENYLIINKM